MKPAAKRSCLIVERHVWETGGRQQQLQFPLEVARTFFGQGNTDRKINIRLFLPASASVPIAAREIVISRDYSASRTRRTNKFAEMSAFPAGFVFFEETTLPNTYDVWWQEDKAIVAARFSHWSQAKDSQYGRGRLAIIVEAPVPRPISRID